jgi:hypothetical protein
VSSLAQFITNLGSDNSSSDGATSGDSADLSATFLPEVAPGRGSGVRVLKLDLAPFAATTSSNTASSDGENKPKRKKELTTLVLLEGPGHKAAKPVTEKPQQQQQAAAGSPSGPVPQALPSSTLTAQQARDDVTKYLSHDAISRKVMVSKLPLDLDPLQLAAILSRISLPSADGSESGVSAIERIELWSERAEVTNKRLQEAEKVILSRVTKRLASSSSSASSTAGAARGGATTKAATSSSKGPGKKAEAKKDVSSSKRDGSPANNKQQKQEHQQKLVVPPAAASQTASAAAAARAYHTSTAAAASTSLVRSNPAATALILYHPSAALPPQRSFLAVWALSASSFGARTNFTSTPFGWLLTPSGHKSITTSTAVDSAAAAAAPAENKKKGKKGADKQKAAKGAEKGKKQDESSKEKKTDNKVKAGAKKEASEDKDASGTPPIALPSTTTASPATANFASSRRAMRQIDDMKRKASASSPLHAAALATCDALRLFGIVIGSQSGSQSCRITPASEARVLYVGGLRASQTPDYVCALLSEWLSDCGMELTPTDRGRVRSGIVSNGEVFIEFPSHADAVMAAYALRGAELGPKEPIVVGWASNDEWRNARPRMPVYF